ncbi:MAG TPA: Nif11-like leader peptide family natural product precursor [Leptolyngbya sp.]|jgi:predicted ribosomally synthesized peptide with nif11-like leader|nr:Nif11-like leader peptide family natural product precursor [Leptolyngbya sp.]
MSQHHAAEFFKAVHKDHALKVRLQAMSDRESFVKLASDHGYRITESEVEDLVDRLPESELAALFNPGVGERQRLIPR